MNTNDKHTLDNVERRVARLRATAFKIVSKTNEMMTTIALMREER